MLNLQSVPRQCAVSLTEPTFVEDKTMKQLLHRLWSDDSGQDLIEYALIATLLVLVIISGMNGLAGSIQSDYSRIGTSM